MSFSSANVGPRICVAMIVRNAAETLEASLQSVASIADEIVLLDTGSTDDTCAIAKRFKAMIRQHAWENSFSAARNKCVADVFADWVLWLDAGETLSPADAQGLRQFVNSRQAELSRAYAMLIKVPAQTGGIAAEQIARVRLIPNLPGLKFTGRVRESMAPSFEQYGIQVDGLPFRIHRTAREHDPQTKIRRARRNLMLADMEIKEHGPVPRLLNCIGDALQILGDNKQAAEFFRQAVQLSERGSTDMLEAYYGWITTFDSDPEARQTQLTICLQAMEVFPLDAQLICAMGGYLQSQGRLDLAVRSYQTASQYGQINPETWHLDEILDIAANCESIALQLQGKFEEARQVLEAALVASPQSLRLHRQLIELLVKTGRRKEAIAQTQLLPANFTNVEAYRIAIRGACLAQAKNWIGACAYLETAYKAGCREILCLRWFTATLLALQHYEIARPVIQAWLEIEPNNVEAQGHWKSLPAVAAASSVNAGPNTIPPPTGADKIHRVDHQYSGAQPSVLMPNTRATQPLPASPKSS